jgi:single-stranded-DNA-specific exonuclease
MVPLVEENRILCKTGLELINSGRRPGLAALLKASSIYNQTLDAEDVAFRLAPRINAAGRMDHAVRAVELLIAEDIDLAAKSAHTLNLLNQKRQQLEKRTLEDIQSYLELNPSLLRQRSLVLSREGWHAGLLGIVASRILNTYHRPVILITIENGVGKGSGRSIAGLNLYDALAACDALLEDFGGHSMAAGLKIKEENISDFQSAFENVVRLKSQTEDFIPTIKIDSELDFSAISDGLIDELESLTPYGTANPEPLFKAADVKVVSASMVGTNHRRMALRQSSAPNTPVLQAIHFNVADRKPLKNSFYQIVFRLRWNRWNSKKAVQLVIEDMQ